MKNIIKLLIFLYETFFRKAIGPQDGAESKEDVEATDSTDVKPGGLDDIDFEIDATKVDSYNTKRLHVIDPGHVQGTPGKVSPTFEDGSVLHEYEINHCIASRLSAILTVDYGFVEGRDYIITLPQNFEFKSVYKEIKARFEMIDRLKTSKELVFYSIHHNAIAHGGQWQKPSGTETWYQRGNEKSKQVAALFQKNLVSALGFRDRGLKTAEEGKREFMVFRECNARGIVGVLLEIGFFSNLEEAKRLKTTEYRKQAAQAIAKTIAELEGLTLKKA